MTAKLRLDCRFSYHQIPSELQRASIHSSKGYGLFPSPTSYNKVWAKYQAHYSSTSCSTSHLVSPRDQFKAKTEPNANWVLEL